MSYIVCVFTGTQCIYIQMVSKSHILLFQLQVKNRLCGISFLTICCKILRYVYSFCDLQLLLASEQFVERF